jgi:hypothetical protein
MDDVAVHALPVYMDTETTAPDRKETAPLPEPKRDGRGGRIHSVYDLGAVDKMSRAARAKVAADADAEIALLQIHLDGTEVQRPRTRGDCLPGGCNAIRPCPYVGCAYHLYLEVNKETGSLQVNFPGQEPWELSETCALDVVDREHGVTLEKVGELLQRTRERVRQIEAAGMDKVRRHLKVLTE